MELLRYLHNHYWENSSFLLMYIACLWILYVKREKWKTGYNVLFKYSLITLMGIIYNPLFLIVVSNGFFQDFAAYFRIFYLLPIFTTMAYVVSKIILENTKGKILPIIIICMIMITGQTFFEEEMYVQKENIYKVSQEVINISETIMEDSGEKTQVVVQASLQDYVYGMRQYTAQIQMVYHFVETEEYSERYQNADISEFIYYLAVLNGKVDFNYIICENYEPLIKDLEICGYQLLLEEESYVILKRSE